VEKMKDKKWFLRRPDGVICVNLEDLSPEERPKAITAEEIRDLLHVEMLRLGRTLTPEEIKQALDRRLPLID
jgi:hypothetical protein